MKVEFVGVDWFDVLFLFPLTLIGDSEDTITVLSAFHGEDALARLSCSEFSVALVIADVLIINLSSNLVQSRFVKEPLVACGSIFFNTDINSFTDRKGIAVFLKVRIILSVKVNLIV